MKEHLNVSTDTYPDLDLVLLIHHCLQRTSDQFHCVFALILEHSARMGQTDVSIETQQTRA